MTSIEMAAIETGYMQGMSLAYHTIEMGPLFTFKGESSFIKLFLYTINLIGTRNGIYVYKIDIENPPCPESGMS